MKRVALLLLSALVLGEIAYSQSPRVRRVPNPPPTRTGSGGGIGGAPTSAASNSGALEKNVAISLKGAIAENVEADVTLTGCGRIMRSNVILDTLELGGNRIPVIGSIEFSITQGEGAYTINYSVGLRTPIPTTSSVRSGGPDDGKTVNTTISYQDVLHSGEVRCEPDKPVTVFKSGDKSLTLAVSEP